MIKFRIDVDYPYPSRIKSFLYIATNLRTSKDYLENSKILARMFNESKKEIKVYWFFTIRTLPDKELLGILNNSKHEIALHVLNSPFQEYKLLEETTNQKIKYYSIHGTSHLLSRLLWKRYKNKYP